MCVFVKKTFLFFVFNMDNNKTKYTHKHAFSTLCLFSKYTLDWLSAREFDESGRGTPK